MYSSVQAFEGTRTKLFIGGEWVDPHSGRYLDSYDPTTGETWYEAADADAEDIDGAVQAATQALWNPAWRRMTQTDRGRLIRRLADLIAQDEAALAAIETASFMSPAGGFKNSGYGKHNGFEGIRELSRVKSVVIDYSGAGRDPFVMRVR